MNERCNEVRLFTPLGPGFRSPLRLDRKKNLLANFNTKKRYRLSIKFISYIPLTIHSIILSLLLLHLFFFTTQITNRWHKNKNGRSMFYLEQLQTVVWRVLLYRSTEHFYKKKRFLSGKKSANPFWAIYSVEVFFFLHLLAFSHIGSLHVYHSPGAPIWDDSPPASPPSGVLHENFFFFCYKVKKRIFSFYDNNPTRPRHVFLSFQGQVETFSVSGSETINVCILKSSKTMFRKKIHASVNVQILDDWWQLP